MTVLPKPKGLINLGNTCYFNSIMQVLLNAPLFGPLLEDRTLNSDNKYIMDGPNSDGSVELELPECDFAVRSLVDLYKAYVDSKGAQAISPNKLINCIRQKTGRFQRLVQEDSHELLRSLIDIVRSDEIRRHKAAISSYLGDSKSTEIKTESFTLIDMIFGGYFLSSVKCQKCRINSEHLEPFFDLSLAITDPINDVRSAIANFTANAILDGDNKFICERCSKVNGKKTYEAGVKSTKIAVPPNVLTLHLKRFEASSGADGHGRGLGGGRKGGKKNNSGGGGKRRTKHKAGGGGENDDDDGDSYINGRGGVSFRKINKHVTFTEFLDLAEFTCSLCYDLTKINKWPRIHRKEPIWYSLFGVVCHSGNLRGGHYTAFVKCEDHINENFSMEDFAEFIQETPYMSGLADVDRIRDYIRQYDATHCETTDKYRDDTGDDYEGDTQDDSDDDHLGPNNRRFDNSSSKHRKRRDNSSTSNGHYLNSNDYDRPKSIPGDWWHISDSDVRKSNLANVLNSQAYILFYRRLIE